MNSGTRSAARTATLEVSRWHHVGRYLAALALMPAAGLGIMLWMRTEMRRRASTVVVEEARIRIGDPQVPASQRVVDLARIERISVRRERHVSAWMGVRTVVVTTPGGDIPLEGLADGEAVAAMFRQALDAIRARRTERPAPEASSRTIPGSTEQLNELALLWQQGLITDEQYQAERRRFS